MSKSELLQELERLCCPDDFEPYKVNCARCGKEGMCTEFMVEEGDEWECPECWERCEAAERTA